jgi:hypothetical protein
MLKILLNIFKWLLLLAIGIYFVLLASNWGDEDLKPEVQAILNQQAPIIADDNGYLILLGMGAPLDQDALQVGKKKLTDALTRFELARKSPTKSIVQENTSDNFTPYHESAGLQDYICALNQAENCVAFYLKVGEDKRKQLMASQQGLLTRYEAIKRSKNFMEVSVPSSGFDMSGISALTAALALEHMQTVQDIADGNTDVGVKRLTENALHTRKMLQNSSSHLTSATLISMVQQDVQLLSHLLSTYPALAKQYKQELLPLLMPISSSEYDLERPFINDRAQSVIAFDMVINSIKFREKNAKLSFYEKLKGVNFQPNATLNLLYDRRTLSHRLAKTQAHRLAQVKAQIEAEKKALFGFGFRPYYLKNTIGKVLVNIFDATDLLIDVEALHDTEGYIRLVRAQLHILTENTPKENIAQVLVQYPNPYTLQPFVYDAGVLKFEGRSTLFGGPKNAQFEVKI